MHKRRIASLLLANVFACGGSQPRTEMPVESSPAYTTSSSPQNGSPAGETHVMPDGTVMPGRSHGEHQTPGDHQHHGHDAHGSDHHVMPDGTVMPGRTHAEHAAPQHVMPDGGVMQGHTHPGATHVMPDGAVMPGASHGGHNH